MILTHDLPASQGVVNALKRAKRLVEARFTPIRQFPIVVSSTDPEGERTYIGLYASAHLPEKGMPYSSVRRYETYIGYNISFETFYTALTNPDSVVYTQPITGTGQNVHNRYVIVCSCFVSDVLDIRYRTPCIRWPDLPGISEIPAEPLEDLSLCDILLNVKRHIAIITDIERDENGIVRYITVSESVLPNCRATRFTPEEFRNYWYGNDFKVFRYDRVDNVTYTPDPFLPLPEDGPMDEPKVNRVMMTDLGNKANYKLGENVKISVFDPAFDTLSLKAPDGSVSSCPVREGKCVIKPEQPGFYSVTAAAAVGNGESAKESDPLQFCVTDLTFTMDKETYAPGETIRIHFRNSAGDPLIAWQFNRSKNDRGLGGGFYTDLSSEGDIELVRPDTEDTAELYLMAKNAYGVYSSERVRL